MAPSMEARAGGAELSDSGPEAQLRSCSAPEDSAPFLDQVKALPLVLQSSILHCAGRPARLTCRAFRDGYGPLPSGLILQDIATPDDLLNLVPSPAAPRPFSSIHTLRFILATPLTPALLSAVPTVFPNLRCLQLQPTELKHEHDTAPTLLAALCSTLTHLACPSLDPLVISSLPAALPALRSLHMLHSCDWIFNLGETEGALPGGLPQLQDFEYALTTYGDSWPESDSATLALLARIMPSLTRLHLQGDILTGCWDPPPSNLEEYPRRDPEAIAILASNWPDLRDLRLNLWKLMGSDLVAALAPKTALTCLDIDGGFSTGPDSCAFLAHLPQLRELRIVLRSACNYQQSCAGLALLRCVTRLVLVGCEFQITPDLTDHLSQLADSLVSLQLGSFVQVWQWPQLAQLSSLTRLQALKLHRDTWGKSSAWVERQDLEQAANAAAGLQRLQSLDVQALHQRQVERGLVARLAAHGSLRQLHVGEWDTRWPPCLLAAASTLMRLSIFCRTARQVPLVVSSLSGLTRLQHLEVRVGWCVTGEELIRSRERILHGEPDAAEWPQWSELQAGAQGCVKGAGGGGRVWLPPHLRVLVVELMQRENWLHWQDGIVAAPSELEESARFEKVLDDIWGQLQAASAQQGCVVQRRQRVPAEWDDCGGYEDGATWEWRLRRGQV